MNNILVVSNHVEKMTGKGLLPKGIAAFLCAVLMVCLVMPANTEDAKAAGTSSQSESIGKVAALSADGFKKIENSWYYIKNDTAVKGLKKINKKLYYFNSEGVMQSGLVKHGKAFYYFRKNSKGQAPAITEDVAVLNNKVWFFRKNGKRYNFGFNDTGSRKGNIAAGMIISGSNAGSKKTARKRLEKAYRYVLKRSKYRHTKAPALKNNKWIPGYAYNMAVKKKGQCYGFGAISSMIAKAMGYKAFVVYGKVTFSGRFTPGAHTWAYVVLKGKRYILDASPDRSYHPKGKGKLGYFLKKISKKGGHEKVAGRPSKYYPKKRFTLPNVTGGKTADSDSGKSGLKIVKWSKKKKKLYHSDGSVVKGIAVYKGKFYAFTKKGVFRKAFTKKLRRAAVANKKISALKKLTGSPDKKEYSDSCRGKTEGKDGVWYYEKYLVLTFKPKRGAEVFAGAEQLY